MCFNCNRRVRKGFTGAMHLLLDNVSSGYGAKRPFLPTDCVTEVRHVLPLSIQGDTQMLWAGIFAGGAGLLLSARYRVGALIVAGMVGIIAMLCVSPFANWTAAATLVNTLAMLCSLNAGYLLGFAISCARARYAVRTPRRSRQWPHGDAAPRPSSLNHARRLTAERGVVRPSRRISSLLG